MGKSIKVENGCGNGGSGPHRGSAASSSSSLHQNRSSPTKSRASEAGDDSIDSEEKDMSEAQVDDDSDGNDADDADAEDDAENNDAENGDSDPTTAKYNKLEPDIEAEDDADEVDGGTEANEPKKLIKGKVSSHNMSESQIRAQQASLANEYTVLARLLAQAVEKRTSLTLKKIELMEKHDKNEPQIVDDRPHLQHMAKLLAYQVNSIRSNSKHEVLNAWRDCERNKADLREKMAKEIITKISLLRHNFEKSRLVRSTDVPVMDWISFNLDTVHCLRDQPPLACLEPEDTKADIVAMRGVPPQHIERPDSGEDSADFEDDSPPSPEPVIYHQPLEDQSKRRKMELHSDPSARVYVSQKPAYSASIAPQQYAPASQQQQQQQPQQQQVQLTPSIASQAQSVGPQSIASQQAGSRSVPQASAPQPIAPQPIALKTASASGGAQPIAPAPTAQAEQHHLQSPKTWGSSPPLRRASTPLKRAPFLQRSQLQPQERLQLHQQQFPQVQYHTRVQREMHQLDQMLQYQRQASDTNPLPQSPPQPYQLSPQPPSQIIQPSQQSQPVPPQSQPVPPPVVQQAFQPPIPPQPQPTPQQQVSVPQQQLTPQQKVPTPQQQHTPHQHAASLPQSTPTPQAAAIPQAAPIQQGTPQQQQYYVVSQAPGQPPQYQVAQTPGQPMVQGYQYYPGFPVVQGYPHYQYALPAQYAQAPQSAPAGYVYAYPEQWQQQQQQQVPPPPGQNPPQQYVQWPGQYRWQPQQ